MEPLTVLTSFVIAILFGILASIVSTKVGISNVLLLVLSGIGLAQLNEYLGYFELPELGMVILSVVALVLLIFDGSSRFKMKVLDDFSVDALKLTVAFVFFNLLIVLPGFLFLFNPELGVELMDKEGFLIPVLYGAILAILLASTDPASVFYMLKDRNSKSVDFIEVESVFNTPVIVILPFLLLDVIGAVNDGGSLVWGEYGVAFLNEVVVGVGTGVVVGLVFFKAMKHFYSEEISPLSIITSALLSYILAENLEGSGVLAVAVLGFMFGNVYVAKKDVLKRFNEMLGNSLEILVFILLGFIVQLDIDVVFLLKALGLFGLVVVSRWLSVHLVLPESFSRGEKWFITLNMTKGIAVAVMIFSLSLLPEEPLSLIGDVLVVTMIYSVVVSTVANKFSEKLIDLH